MMKRILLALVPWMAMAVANASETSPATVVYTYHGEYTRGFERDDNECLADARSVSMWGWQVRFLQNEADVLAENRRVRVPTIIGKDGSLKLPLSLCLAQLGGVGKWDKDNSTYVITSMIRRIEFKGEKLVVDATLDISPRVIKLDDPDRMVIDLRGGSISDPPSITKLKGVRVGEYDNHTARVVLEQNGINELPIPATRPGRSFEFALTGYAFTAPAEVSKVAVIPDDGSSRSAAPTKSVPPPAAPKKPSAKVGGEPNFENLPTAQVFPTDQPIKVGTPRIYPQMNGDVNIVFPINKRLVNSPSGSYQGPLKINFRIPGSVADKTGDIAIVSNVVSGLQLSNDSRGSTNVSIDTARPMGFRLSSDAATVTIVLVRPKSADGKIAGKTIVVDAGHGGVDSGCVSRDKTVREKDLTLKISKMVAQELTDEGCAVILTRDDDVKIPLGERAAIANRSNADIFVSIHINDNSVNNSRSGVSIYYHGFSNLSKLLSECIQSEVDKVSGLPTQGTKADTIRFKTGFAVLRLSSMPACLAELGFINHSTDVKVMVTEAFQRRVAKAIVKGIKVFLGDEKSTQISSK